MSRGYYFRGRIMKPLKEQRKFGKHKYGLAFISPHKKEAKKVANRQRDSGERARIVKVGRRYAVYVRGGSRG